MAVPPKPYPFRTRLEDVLTRTHPVTVEPTYSSDLPTARAALSAERRCKAKARWEFKQTALQMSSGNFVFYCATVHSLPVGLTEQGVED